jgi:hypothetical protein
MADTPVSTIRSNDAAKRETLTSRAKRIIGRALDTPKDEKDGCECAGSCKARVSSSY